MPIRYTGPMFVNTLRKALLDCYCTSSWGAGWGGGVIRWGGGGGAVSLPTPVNEGQQGG
jgi:hypothetical protein